MTDTQIMLLIWAVSAVCLASMFGIQYYKELKKKKEIKESIGSLLLTAVAVFCPIVNTALVAFFLVCILIELIDKLGEKSSGLFKKELTLYKLPPSPEDTFNKIKYPPQNE